MAEEAKKVLLVDDDPTVLRLFEEYCNIAQLDYGSCSQAEEALALVHYSLEKFGVIVLDINPGTIELAREVRVTQPTLPIIFVTGRLPEDAKVLIDEELKAIIAYKPILLNGFISLIQAALASVSS